jgi:hypothetical protein
MVSWYAERLLVAQRMSTGPSGDCETPLFPDDSDVRATEPRPISLFRAFVRGRPAEVSILILGGRCIDHGPAT